MYITCSRLTVPRFQNIFTRKMIFGPERLENFFLPENSKTKQSHFCHKFVEATIFFFTWKMIWGSYRFISSKVPPANFEERDNSNRNFSMQNNFVFLKDKFESLTKTGNCSIPVLLNWRLQQTINLSAKSVGKIIFESSLYLRLASASRVSKPNVSVRNVFWGRILWGNNKKVLARSPRFVWIYFYFSLPIQEGIWKMTFFINCK